MASRVGVDRRIGEEGGRLAVHRFVALHFPVGVAERQVLEADVVDRLSILCIALESHEHIQARCNGLGLGHVFARAGIVRQQARLAVEVEFAGRIERFADIFDVVAFLATPPANRPTASVGEVNRFLSLCRAV